MPRMAARGGRLMGALAAGLAAAWAPAAATVQDTPARPPEARAPFGVAPRLVTGGSTQVTAGQRLPFPLRIEAVRPVDERSTLIVRGLMEGATLLNGSLLQSGVWMLPLPALGIAAIELPANAGPRHDISVDLVAADGRLLAEATVVLTVRSAPVAAARPAPKPAPATAPVAPTVTPRPADPAAAVRHLARGKEKLEVGDVAPARLLLERAAEGGNAEAALLLGATYDPGRIAGLGIVGMRPDIAEATRWYRLARQLGAGEEAQSRLSALPQR